MPGVPRQTGYTGSYGTSTSRGSTRQRASSLSRENSATRSYTPSRYSLTRIKLKAYKEACILTKLWCN